MPTGPKVPTRSGTPWADEVWSGIPLRSVAPASAAGAGGLMNLMFAKERVHYSKMMQRVGCMARA